MERKSLLKWMHSKNPFRYKPYKPFIPVAPKPPPEIQELPQLKCESCKYYFTMGNSVILHCNIEGDECFDYIRWESKSCESCRYNDPPVCSPITMRDCNNGGWALWEPLVEVPIDKSCASCSHMGRGRVNCSTCNYEHVNWEVREPEVPQSNIREEVVANEIILVDSIDGVFELTLEHDGNVIRCGHNYALNGSIYGYFTVPQNLLRSEAIFIYTNTIDDRIHQVRNTVVLNSTNFIIELRTTPRQTPEACAHYSNSIGRCNSRQTLDRVCRLVNNETCSYFAPRGTTERSERAEQERRAAIRTISSDRFERGSNGILRLTSPYLLNSRDLGEIGELEYSLEGLINSYADGRNRLREQGYDSDLFLVYSNRRTQALFANLVINHTIPMTALDYFLREYEYKQKQVKWMIDNTLNDGLLIQGDTGRRYDPMKAHTCTQGTLIKTIKEKPKPPEPKTFKVNDWITLKLEAKYHDGDITPSTVLTTNIYVKDEKFKQCKYLLLNIPMGTPEDRERQDEINSIDEAAEVFKLDENGHIDLNDLTNTVEDQKLNRKMETDHTIITPEEEFFGHCSNLEAWCKNDYAINVLHTNLSLPLLKRLVEAGCKDALQSLKEQTAERIENGGFKALVMLSDNLKYFSVPEFEVMGTTLMERMIQMEMTTMDQWRALRVLSDEVIKRDEVYTRENRKEIANGTIVRDGPFTYRGDNFTSSAYTSDAVDAAGLVRDQLIEVEAEQEREIGEHNGLVREAQQIADDHYENSEDEVFDLDENNEVFEDSEDMTHD